MKHRKLIDLSTETKKALSIQAINKGMDLKNYIESILDKQAKK